MLHTTSIGQATLAKCATAPQLSREERLGTRGNANAAFDDYMEMKVDQKNASTLRCTGDGEEAVVRGSLGPHDNPFNMAWYRSLGTSRNGRVPGHPYTVFYKQYLDFVARIVLPQLGGQYVAVQNMPTFRCHLPHTGPTGKPHRDEDYGHPVSEINYWLEPTFL